MPSIDGFHQLAKALRQCESARSAFYRRVTGDVPAARRTAMRRPAVAFSSIEMIRVCCFSANISLNAGAKLEHASAHDMLAPYGEV